MHFHGIDFTILTTPPVVARSQLAAYVEAVNAHVQAGDTIYVPGGDPDTATIIGRVLDVRTTLPTNGERVHPRLRGRRLHTGEFALRILWYMLSDRHLAPGSIAWPGVDPETRRATLGLQQAFETNCLVWISNEIAGESAYIIHAKDCINQVFGSVCRRANTAYINRRAVFKSGEAACDFQILPPEQYHVFGFDLSIRGANHPVTVTERQLHAILQQWRLGQQLLVKNGNMGGTSSGKLVCNREDWLFIQRNIEKFSNEGADDEDEGVVITSTTPKTLQRITHVNLSLESALCRTSKVTVFANTPVGFAAFRRFIAEGFLIGKKGKHPARAAINDSNFNPAPLRETDTINAVEIDLSTYHEEDVLSSWVDVEATDTHKYVQDKHTCVKMVRDSRLGEVRMSLKCCAVIKSTCLADSLVEYLDRNNDFWGEEDDLYNNCNLEIEDETWVVESIRWDDDVATTVNEETGERVDRSIEFCIEHKMG